MKKIALAIGVSLIFILCFTSCNRSDNQVYYSFAGFTQGTSYHITLKLPAKDTVGLKHSVDEILMEFDMSLSTYNKESLISKINRNETNETDNYFMEVFHEALRVYEMSNGAFDITVAPLVDAWGFGRGNRLKMTQHTIDSLLQYVGMDRLKLIDGKVHKTDPHVILDVNSLAQGYSVDIVCDYLDEQLVENYMVEIGGEIRTKGLSSRGIAWRIGIDRPVFGNVLPGQDIQEVISLSGLSLASSGNYRKYREENGEKIVHTIDPITGQTRMSNLLSVTIVCEECMTADAYATTCMVLGLEGAKEFILQQEGVEALLIYSEEGKYMEWRTEGMEGMIAE